MLGGAFIIKMFMNDHPPPHFHVEYAEFAAVIHIETLAVIAGNLPSRALGLTIEWASLHQAELRNRNVACQTPSWQTGKRTKNMILDNFHFYC